MRVKKVSAMSVSPAVSTVDGQNAKGSSCSEKAKRHLGAPAGRTSCDEVVVFFAVDYHK